ncbi:hypothetical protein ETB97_009186 [Aspergillus alliaceus]|uniref:Domain of unknown function at the cortex 1 domain-containing protein n=1 Tax=Petromyces alliaceus TaxID=209559 RepID=A0A5N7CIF8_PETAA|nr:hypothetical protein BDV23DRAFT_180110 [Aspergillus alliaceus]KAF5863900.1 hypothetical protein ETB97_009186 [Aspergillus burnettii]
MSETDTRKYRLKVTAGPSYDPSTHQLVPVNEDQTLRIENELAITRLCVRVQDYTGYTDNSSKTNPYFDHPLHLSDQYSISFAIVFKRPVNANSLLFGNDFDRPIRDCLPPGFNAALRLVKWMIDPTLEGDVYADKPYLYSPAVASWNQFCIGEKITKDDEVPDMHDRVVEEGGEGSGVEVREQLGVPGGVNERRKYFQSEEARDGFVFEEGRVYWVDFGNPYLGFNDFSLRLPGITMNVIQYINEDNHSLRYVLRNRDTGEVYLVVLFTLVLQGTYEEPLHKEAERMKKESKAQHEKNEGKMGRFEWEPEPSADDIE